MQRACAVEQGSAEIAAPFHQNHVCAVARCGDGGDGSGRTAAGDQDAAGEADGGGEFFFDVGDCHETAPFPARRSGKRTRAFFVVTFIIPIRQASGKSQTGSPMQKRES